MSCIPEWARGLRMDRRIESFLKELIARPNHWQDSMHLASRTGWRFGLGQITYRDFSLEG